MVAGNKAVMESVLDAIRRGDQVAVATKLREMGVVRVNSDWYHHFVDCGNKCYRALRPYVNERAPVQRLGGATLAAVRWARGNGEKPVTVEEQVAAIRFTRRVPADSTRTVATPEVLECLIQKPHAPSVRRLLQWGGDRLRQEQRPMSFDVTWYNELRYPCVAFVTSTVRRRDLYARLVEDPPLHAFLASVPQHEWSSHCTRTVSSD